MMIPDMTATDAAVEYQVVPPGTYTARIVAVEEKRAQSNGAPYLSIKFEILDGPFKTRWLFSSLHFTDQALPFTKAKLDAIGYDTRRGQHPFKESDFLGRTVTLDVDERMYNKDGVLRAVADVRAWHKPGGSRGDDPLARPVPTPSGQVAVSVDPDDDIPF